LPLVSVICVCYNHAKYVLEALQSVINQSHSNVELIVIDDASIDGSQKVVNQFILDHRAVVFISNQKNLGYCKSFNKAFNHCSGSFIIDLSADDLLMPKRIEIGLLEFSKRDDSFGVNFTNAENIDESGHSINLHYKNSYKIPEGDIYSNLLARYFICAPTMMFKRQVIEELGGYDEELDYEDFDFWVRSSRKFKYCYTDKVLVKKRKVFGSLSSKQTQKGNTHLMSTLRVCEKAFKLNTTSQDKSALNKRLRFEARQCLRTENYQLISGFLNLMKLNGDRVNYIIYSALSFLRISGI